MSRATIRKSILNGVTSSLLSAFGVKSGSVEKIFRVVRRGPLRLSRGKHPILTVVDSGQRVDRGGDTESSISVVLDFTLRLQLSEDWEKVKASDDWSDRVQKIIDHLHGNLTVGPALERLDYDNDEPIEITFFSGGSDAGWDIEFKAQYFAGSKD